MAKQNEVSLLLQLLHTLDSDPSIGFNPSHRFIDGQNVTVDRIVCKLKKQVQDRDSNTMSNLMAINGYPLLPLIQDLVSVRLYGVQTTKGIISFEPSVMYA